MYTEFPLLIALFCPLELFIFSIQYESQIMLVFSWNMLHDLQLVFYSQLPPLKADARQLTVKLDTNTFAQKSGETIPKPLLSLSKWLTISRTHRADLTPPFSYLTVKNHMVKAVLCYSCLLIYLMTRYKFLGFLLFSIIVVICRGRVWGNVDIKHSPPTVRVSCGSTYNHSLDFLTL